MEKWNVILGVDVSKKTPTSTRQNTDFRCILITVTDSISLKSGVKTKRLICAKLL